MLVLMYVTFALTSRSSGHAIAIIETTLNILGFACSLSNDNLTRIAPGIRQYTLGYANCGALDETRITSMGGNLSEQKVLANL